MKRKILFSHLRYYTLLLSSVLNKEKIRLRASAELNKIKMFALTIHDVYSDFCNISTGWAAEIISDVGFPCILNQEGAGGNLALL